MVGRGSDYDLPNTKDDISSLTIGIWLCQWSQATRTTSYAKIKSYFPLIYKNILRITIAGICENLSTLDDFYAICMIDNEGFYMNGTHNKLQTVDYCHYISFGL